MKKTKIFLLLLLLFVYLALRIAFILQVREDIHWRSLSPRTDMDNYHRAGIKLSQGEFPGKEFDLNPLYPLLIIAPVYRFAGINIFSLRIFQILLATFGAYLYFLLLRHLFPENISLYSLLLLALYPPLVVYDSSIQPVFLENLLLISSLLLLVKSRQKKYLAPFSFLILGMGFLSRPTFLPLLPLFLWDRWREERGKAFLNLIYFFLPLLPFLIWNWREYRSLVLLRNKGGIVFLIGNNPYATGSSGLPSFYWKELSKKWEGLNPVEKDRMAYLMAFRFIKENPGKFLRLLGRKTVLFWGREDIPNNVNVLYARQISFLKYIPLSFGIIFPLALAGLILCLREFKRYYLFYLTLGGIYIFTILFLVVGRYRLPVIYFLLPFFFLALDKIKKSLSEKTSLYPLILPFFLYLLYFTPALRFRIPALLNPRGFVVKNRVWVIRDEDGKPPPPLLNHRYRAILQRKGEGVLKILYFPFSPHEFSRIHLKIYVGVRNPVSFLLTVNGKTREVTPKMDTYPYYGWITVPVPPEIVRKGKNEIVIEYLRGEVEIYLDDKFDFNRSAFLTPRGEILFRYPDRKSHRKAIPAALGDGEFKIEWEVWK